MLVYFYFTMIFAVGIFCLAVQRRRLHLARQELRRLCPYASCSTAAAPEAEKPLYGQVIRRGPAAIEAERK